MHDRINDQEGVSVFNHGPGSLGQQGAEGIAGEGSANHDVVKDLFWVQLIPLGYALDALWPEGIFGVDVEYFALTTTLGSWELSSHTKGHGQLRLSSSEFTKSLGNRHTFHTSLKEHVK